VADIDTVQIMHLVIWSPAMVALAVWAPRIPYVTTIVKNCRGVRQDSDGRQLFSATVVLSTLPPADIDKCRLTPEQHAGLRQADALSCVNTDLGRR
jgi:hypothetical protein